MADMIIIRSPQEIAAEINAIRRRAARLVSALRRVIDAAREEYRDD